MGWRDHRNAKQLTQEFADYLQEQADEIDALTIYFHTPARGAEVTYPQIKALLEIIKQDRPKLAPLRIWQAYGHLDNYTGDSPLTELTALVALIRRVCGMDSKITPFGSTVRKNFQDWIMKYHAGGSNKFNMTPFNAKGGLMGMYQQFGDKMDWVIEELNRELVA